METNARKVSDAFAVSYAAANSTTARKAKADLLKLNDEDFAIAQAEHNPSSDDEASEESDIVEPKLAKLVGKVLEIKELEDTKERQDRVVIGIQTASEGAISVFATKAQAKGFKVAVGKVGEFIVSVHIKGRTQYRDKDGSTPFHQSDGYGFIGSKVAAESSYIIDTMMRYPVESQAAVGNVLASIYKADLQASQSM